MKYTFVLTNQAEKDIAKLPSGLAILEEKFINK